MTWENRLQEATYTSPKGEVFSFIYESVSVSATKKTTAFSFPGGSGTYIQDLGSTGRRYKQVLFFSGEDYDLQAESFFSALEEVGIGKLAHPLYGTFDVVPFGEIARRDDLVDAANQAAFEVTFYETTGLVFPSVQEDASSQLASAIAEFNQASADKLSEELNIANEFERVSFQSVYQASLNAVKNTFDQITQAQEDANKQLNNVFNSISEGVDVLIGQPATLAFQTNILLQTPSLMADSIKARVDAYTNLINQFTTGSSAVKVPGNDNTAANDFQNADLYTSGGLVAFIDNVANEEFETKTDALQYADTVLDLFDQVNAWREANYSSLGLVDTGSMYQKLQNAVALTAGFLVQISFTLKQERTFILDRDRTMIDLVAELYGNIDESLDFFINTNDLSGDEYKELKKGRQIVYFV
jgi:prophage DNA circulation protein